MKALTVLKIARTMLNVNRFGQKQRETLRFTAEQFDWREPGVA